MLSKPKVEGVIEQKHPTLWKNKNFIRLWLGQTISQFGDKLYLLALPWLVLELTNSVLSATLTLALEIVTEVLFAPFVGVLVDRFSRKKIMIFADLMRGILMLSIPLLFVLDALYISYIYLVAIGLSLLTLIFDSSSQAYLPSILSKEQLMEGNAKLTMIATIMRMVGPVAAGVSISVWGAHVTIGLNGLTFLLSLLFLLGLSHTQTHFSSRKENQTYREIVDSLNQEIKEGFLYLIKHPVLWPITIFSAMMNISIMGVQGLFVFESKIGQGASSDTTAMIFWISGIFAFIASLLVKPLNQYVTKGQLIRFGSIIVGIALGLVALFPSVWSMIVCFTLLLVVGLFVNVSMMTLRQEIVPNHLLGRVMTTTRVLNQALAPLAIILGGILANQVSVQFTFAIATIIVGLNVCFAWFGKMKKIA
ncbi:MFS transporter [Caldalkalibacillus mannanilyticus]|uniref:MFS transporter n=1 Tax=Caldalkalibacillus mannanilyticus TaxID=1418 RepID=UPI00046A478F|nr:MFS transporter [Caldalkalibacillus mannanilyticus]